MSLSRRKFLKLTGIPLSSAFFPVRDLLFRAQSTSPLIVDGHLDLGWNITSFGRDYTQSAYAIRADPAQAAVQLVEGQAMIGLPELLAGRVALIVSTIYVMPGRDVNSSLQLAHYSTPEEAERWGMIMLADIKRLAAASRQFRLVCTQADLSAVWASWADPSAENHQVGILIVMEGADPITQPDHLQAWYELGLRGVGLAWGRTTYAGSSSEPGELTDQGVRLLNEMSRLGMILDVAHLAETAFWQAIDLWNAPLVYSHGNSRYFLPSERGVSDDQIRAIAERSGLVGIGVYGGFYVQHLTRAEQVTLADMVNAIDYVCQLLGDCDHVAIGSDSDGGFGAESAVSGIDTVADLQKIPQELALRGYLPAQIDAITHDNWLRIFKDALP